jgi:hypothetical protein
MSRIFSQLHLAGKNIALILARKSCYMSLWQEKKIVLFLFLFNSLIHSLNIIYISFKAYQLDDSYKAVDIPGHQVQ